MLRRAMAPKANYKISLVFQYDFTALIRQHVGSQNLPYSMKTTSHVMLLYLSSCQNYPDMREPRAKFGIIWVPDGRLFAIGAKSSSGGSTSAVEMLNTPNQASTFIVVWTNVASMSNPRESHGVAFFDGKFVAVGRPDECSVFALPSKDNVLGKWSAISQCPSPFALQALLPADNLLIGIRESVSVLLKLFTFHAFLQVIQCGFNLAALSSQSNISTHAINIRNVICSKDFSHRLLASRKCVTRNLIYNRTLFLP